MFSSTSLLQTIGLTATISSISLTSLAQPTLQQQANQSAKPTAGSTLGGPITPSENPFAVDSPAPAAAPPPGVKNPSGQGVFIWRNKDVTVDFSPFKQQKTLDSVPVFDEQNRAGSGFYFRGQFKRPKQ